MCKQNFKLLIMSACVVACFLINACAKSGGADSVDNRTLRVLEFKTNSPIANADVYLIQCIRREDFGCLQDSIIRRTITDDKGNFQYNLKLNFYLITAHHNNYWDGETGGITSLSDIYLTPLAYTKIHLKKVNAHGKGSLLRIVLSLEPFSSLGGVFGSYGLPVDTTVLFESYGNCNNYIYWYFTDSANHRLPKEKGGNLPGYYINRFDTATAEIDY